MHDRRLASTDIRGDHEFGATPTPSAESRRRAEDVRLEASADLPTVFGKFRLLGFAGAGDGREHVAIVRGHVFGSEAVPVRIHSECLTGDAFGSLRCDCREQLERSLRTIGALPQGVVVYLRQEGRGIGLINKIRAYALQESGLDTIDANVALGFRADERDYGVAAGILGILGVRSIRLLTNNPDKVRALAALGVDVERVPHVVSPGAHNRAYLETKVSRAGHMIELPNAVPSKRT